MTKYNFIIDIEKCEDCNNCFLACKDEHVDNNWPGVTLSQPRHGHRWINIMRKERGTFPYIDAAYRPTPCMHCDDAPCIAVSQNNAVSKRPDGIVLIDPEKAKGDKALVKACPYGAIFWNEQENVAQKCTFCAHLLDSGWEEPRCVQACPTGALNIVKTDDDTMKKMCTEQQMKTLLPDQNTRPRVYYQNLYRFDRCFIAGSVSVISADIMDCVQGAAVMLLKDNNMVSETTTDHFGEFKFDNLKPDHSCYEIQVTYDEFKKDGILVKMTGNTIVPDIVFKKDL